MSSTIHPAMSYWKDWCSALTAQSLNCKSCGLKGCIDQVPRKSPWYLKLICNSEPCRERKSGKTWLTCLICLKYAGSSKHISCSQGWYKHVKAKVHLEALDQWNKFQSRDVISSPRSNPTSDGNQIVNQLVSVADRHYVAGGKDDYFRHELMKGGSGISFLVAQSNFRKCYDSSNDVVRDDDALLDFSTAHALNDLTHSERKRITKIIYGWYELGRRHMREDQQPCQLGPGPRRIVPCMDYTSAQNRYFAGNLSIVKRMPIPTVNNSIANHSYLSINECLRDLLSRGTRISLITLSQLFDDWGEDPREVGSLLDSPFARSRMMQCLLKSSCAMSMDVFKTMDKDRVRGLVLQGLREQMIDPEKVVFGGIVFWSDGVDPNCSKMGRSNVWAASATFVPQYSNWNSRFNTYPLAIAREKTKKGVPVDHLPCLSEINKEMAAMETLPPQLVYYRNVDKELYLSVVRLSHFGDQPERRKVTMTAMGNQNYHGRFRCSAANAKLMSALTPCEACVTSLRNDKEPIGCKKCCCWDALPKDEDQKILLEMNPPKDYPTDHLDDNTLGTQYLTKGGKIAPFRVEFDRLVDSVQLAYRNFVEGKWTSTQTQAFLDRECVIGSLIKSILGNGLNDQQLRDATSEASTMDPAYVEELLQDFETYPERFKAPEIPFYWDSKSGLPLQAFVDCPMHLLFLGIVKKTILVLKEWMKQQEMFTDFVKKAETINSLLDEQMLEWLKVLAYRDGKLGGWVSENLLAFSRILNWFFQQITDLIRDQRLDSVPPTELPDNNWRKIHYARWLKDRGQNTKGTVAELKIRVQHLINLPEGPPKIVGTVAGYYSTDQVGRVLIALDGMLKSIMVDNVVPGVTSKNASLWIKRYLTEINLLAQQITFKDKKPLVVSCSNFLTLLNIPSMMENFGPMRLVWEGGIHGEAFVRCIKPYLQYGLRENFSANAIKHCLVDAAFSQSKECFTDRDSHGHVTRPEISTWKNCFMECPNSFKVYSSSRDVNVALGQRKILPVVAYKGTDGSVNLIVLLGGDDNDLEEDVHSRGCNNRVNMQSLHNTKFRTINVSNDCPDIVRFGYRYQSCYASFAEMEFDRLEVSYPFLQGVVSWGCLLPLLETGGRPMHTLITKDRWTF